MIKKKMLAIGMGCIISMASIVPAFALENVVKDTEVKQVKSERQENRSERRLRLQETEAKLGLNIEVLPLNGLTTKIDNLSKEVNIVKKESISEKRRERRNDEKAVNQQ